MSVVSNNILAGASGQGGAGYEIERSLRFDDAADSHLSKTFAAAGNRKKWTLSFWTKRTGLGTEDNLFTASGNYIRFEPSDVMRLNNGSIVDSTRVFRDPSAWYHVVWVWDTAQATASDRSKVYVNNEIVTFSGYPAQNADSTVNNNVQHIIGAQGTGVSSHGYDGYIADMHFIDGQALAPTDFGETDEFGVWQPIKYAGTYGTNGFHLDFSDNSSNAALGTDTSGNSNTWTVNNLTAESPTTLPGVAFDGSGDYLTLADDNDFELGSNDFTAELFVKFDTITGSYIAIFSKYGSDFQYQLLWDVSNTSWLWNINGASAGNTTYTFSDTIVAGKWYHLALTKSGTTARVFRDGTQIGSDTTVDHITNTGTRPFALGTTFGGSNTALYELDGVISNFRLIKGTALYTSGFTVPSTPLTNVTNTVLLCCQSSSSTTAATVKPGTITANGNVYAVEVSDSSSANDSLRDTPTNGTQVDSGVGGEVVSNYATLNPLSERKNQGVMYNGNLTLSSTNNYYIEGRSTIPASQFNNYSELTITGVSSNPSFGLAIGDKDAWIITGGGSYIVYREGGDITSYPGNVLVDTVASYTLGDVIGMAVDNTNVKFYKNGSLQGTYNHGQTGDYFVTVMNINGSVSGAYTICDVNFGQRAFNTAAPAGYKALCTANLPDPTIEDGSKYFDIKLYTGTGSALSITMDNSSMSPDFVWLKARNDAADHHHLFDTVRGAGKRLFSNLTNAESTDNNTLSSFDSNGFSLGAQTAVNGSGDSMVGWAWDAGSSNTTIAAGSLNSSLYDQSQTWSNNTTGTFASNFEALAFNGELSTSGSTGRVRPSNATTAGFTFSSLGTVTSLRIWVHQGGTGGTVFTVNGTDVTSTVDATANNSFVDFGSTFNSLTAITFNAVDGTNWYSIAGVEVNGKLLVDSGVSITTPSIASTVRANPSAGFSIVSYTGSSSATTVGHGLNAAPQMIIVKDRDNAYNWQVNHIGIGVDESLLLNSTSAATDYNAWNNNRPTSSVFSLGAGTLGVNTNGADLIAYCFAPVEGYSAMGSFSTNGTADNAFVFTGFRPSFLMTKRTDGVGNWLIYDAKRDADNLVENRLLPNLSNAENTTNAGFDFLSNGFKVRTSVFASGQTHLYLAFAEHPFKTSRAR